MYRLFFLFFVASICVTATNAYAFSSIVCGKYPNGKYACFVQTQSPSVREAVGFAISDCKAHNLQECATIGPNDAFENSCKSVSATPDALKIYSTVGADFNRTEVQALSACLSQDNNGCITLATACDIPKTSISPPPSNRIINIFYISPITIGISCALGTIIILLLYAKRTVITNTLIHRGLPFTLPVYGEDIQCLFKRTQRVNWYGRVVFGVVANLSMTQDQLTDTRKYWLGRVIVFDSLRRQRQNELARMHLQLAASIESKAKDKRALSQFLSAIKTLLLSIFYLIRALLSVLLGFLFIRITIAKLVQGAVIESKDLVLILQAKEAIEQSTTYLKEYLLTARTFDGRDEIYEPK